MKEDFQAVLDRAGFGKRVVSVPAWPARVALRVMESLGLSPLYKWVYDTATQESVVGVERARRKLGFAPRFSNSEALVRNYDWYLNNLEAIESSTGGVSHRAAWKQGILGLAKHLF